MNRKVSMLALIAAAGLFAAPAQADTSKMKIAFSNNYAGNSWRQAMLKSYDIVTKKAVADKIVAAADVFTTADKEVPTQAAQIQNLILQGYNAIVINAASPDALNGAIKQACDAGIVVVSFDGIVTEPCAYRVVVDFKDMGKEEVDQMAKFEPKGGNLLEIRGLAGTSIDDAIHAGILEGVKQHPDFKIVSSVTGDWDQTTAQKAVATVLPSLPPIVGVVDQGGDGYGAAQAFAAAGKPRPTIIMGNRQDELPGGRSRRTRTATRPGRLRSRRASRRSPSGSPSRSSTARRFPTTWSCPISPSPRTTSRRNCRTFRRAASPAMNTRKPTPSPRSRPI